jgi:hypothetical protein
MQDFSRFHQLQLSVLGRIYAFAYMTTLRSFLGLRRSSWLKGGTFGLFLVAWIFDWPSVFLFLFLLLTSWVRFIYWRSSRAGYSKFVASKTAVSPPTEFPPLSPNEHVKLRATGRFALSSREDTVLLRPAEYWKIPLGDHVVMVEQAQGHFLYQFFNGEIIETVQTGLLIFGREPLLALAISFCSKWGPEFNDLTQFYYVKNGSDTPPCNKRTIYFTFTSDREHATVWHTIVNSIN